MSPQAFSFSSRESLPEKLGENDLLGVHHLGVLVGLLKVDA